MKGGSKGKLFSDRELAGQVRNLALDHLMKVLDPKYKDKTYQKAMLLKIAPTLLPRLNEHTGEDGKPIVLSFDNAFQGATPSTPKANSGQ